MRHTADDPRDPRDPAGSAHDLLAAVPDEVRRRHEQLRDTVARLQETLDYLRVSIKYLAFDVEATRRENAYLRGLVEQQDGAD